jgi:hypothetical protein
MRPAFPLGIYLPGNNRVRRPRFPDRRNGPFAAFGPKFLLETPVVDRRRTVPRGLPPDPQ